MLADEVIRALNFSPALAAGGEPPLAPPEPAGELADASVPASGARARACPPGQATGAGASEEVLKVFVRVRPTPPDEEHCVQIISETELLFSRPAQGSNTQEGYGERYSFTRAFGPNTPNDELFAQTTLPLVRGLFQQRDGLLFAYGVTNAGKTYTIQGSKDDPGIVPRALRLVFSALDEIETHRATQSQLSLEACRLDSLGVEVDLHNDFRVVLSYLEVYNENVYDLLADQLSGIHVQRAVLKTKEDASGRIFIPGLKEIQISSHEEALAVVHYGAQQRQVAQTRLNSDSSRSHAILTVQLCRVGASAADASIARLCVVDLAGAERVARTEAGGARLKEASKINTSLLTLGRCMEILRANAARPRGAPARVVPFRESKMTRLLHDYFVSGVGSMGMIVAVHPGVADADETVHTLRFSAVARDVHAMDLKYPASGPLSLRSAALAAVRRQHTAAAASASQLAALDGDDAGLAESDAELESARGEDIAGLQQQLSTMRRRLMETERRCLNLESEIRDEVAAEMSERLAEMEAIYKQRLDGGGSEERHQEKLALYKAHSARKAESDATASHLQLVERVKEYERALVSAEEAHAEAVQAVREQQADALDDALHEAAAAHARERSAQQQRHAQELAQVRAGAQGQQSLNSGSASASALDAAQQRAEASERETISLRAECSQLREQAAEREAQIAAEMAEKVAQVEANKRMEVEILEDQLRSDALEKSRLLARAAELEGRLHELIAIAQHNMARSVHDGSSSGAPLSARGGAKATPRLAAREPVHAIGAPGTAARAAEKQLGPAAAALSEQRALQTRDAGLGIMQLEASVPNGLLSISEPSPAKRKLPKAVSSAQTLNLDLDANLAAASDSEGALSADAELDNENENGPKRMKSDDLAHADHLDDGDTLRPLLTARQPMAEECADQDERAATAPFDRSKEIAAKVAARQQEMAARKPAGKGLLGLTFGRKTGKGNGAGAPEPTPVAGRTRSRK